MIRNDRAYAAAIALAVVVAAWGCGRNEGALPAGFSPPGQVPADNQILTQVFPLDAATPPTPGVTVIIYDRTPATAYRVYRSVNSGPFDYAGLHPAVHAGTFNNGYEVFQFTDVSAPVGQPIEYLARAIVNGEETRASALTPVAVIPATANPSDLFAVPFGVVYPRSNPDTTAVTDTLPHFVWQPVAGAQRYAMRIVRSDGEPFFEGLTADASTTYQYGTHAGYIIQERPLTISTYAWAVAALDAQNRVIGVSEFQAFRADTIGFTPVPVRGDDHVAGQVSTNPWLFGGPRSR